MTESPVLLLQLLIQAKKSRHPLMRSLGLGGNLFSRFKLVAQLTLRHHLLFVQPRVSVPVYVQVLSPVVMLYLNVGYLPSSLERAMINPSSSHAVALPLTFTEVYPSKFIVAKFKSDPVAPLANFTAQLLAKVATELDAAEALALLLMLVKDGIAIAARIASTATTTTSSIKEKPLSPGLRLRTFRVLGLAR